MANLFRCGGGRSEASYQNLMDQLVEETATGAIASFTDGANNIPTKEIICHINPTETGTGEKSPQNPYVIGGFTEANIKRTGANIFNKEVGEFGIFYSSSGIITSNNGGYVGDYIPVHKGSTVKIRIFNYEPFYSCSIVEFNEQKEFLNRIQFTTSRLPNEMTGTLQDNTRFICFQIAKPSSNTMTQTDLDEGQIVVSYQSVTSYEPYIEPDTHTVPFGQIVYGGELVLHEGQNDKIMSNRTVFRVDNSLTIRIGAQNYIKSDACDFFVTSDRIYPRGAPKTQPNNLKSDKLTFVPISVWAYDGYPNYFTINDNQIHCNIANDLLGITDYTQETTATVIPKIRAFLANNPIDVIIPVAPEEITLPTKTVIPTFLGANNFYHDCNGDTDVTYRANGALYVQEHPITRGLMAARPTEQIQEQEEQQEEKEINKSEDNER